MMSYRKLLFLKRRSRKSCNLFSKSIKIRC